MEISKTKFCLFCKSTRYKSSKFLKKISKFIFFYFLFFSLRLHSTTVSQSHMSGTRPIILNRRIRKLDKKFSRHELSKTYVRKGYIAYLRGLTSNDYTKKEKAISVLTAPLLEVPKLDYTMRRRARERR